MSARAQDTARIIFKQWAEANGAAPDTADIMMAALYAEITAEAADEVAAMPLPSAVRASGGPAALAVRKALNDASKKLYKLADKQAPTCLPGTHGMFIPCPGTCRLPVVGR